MIFFPHFVCGAVVREVVPSFGCFVLRGSPSSASPTPVEQGKLFAALYAPAGARRRGFSRSLGALGWDSEWAVPENEGTGIVFRAAAGWWEEGERPLDGGGGY